MAFQYINPFLNIPGQSLDSQRNISLNKANAQVSYQDNPIDVSLYNNQGVMYPYGLLNAVADGFMQGYNAIVNPQPYPCQISSVAYDPMIYNLPYNLNPSYVKLGCIQNEDGKIVHLYRLGNGQKVAILPLQNEATIVKTYVDGGSLNEKDNVRGISHTIEHCLFKGSSKLADGDVFRLTGLMGASTNASTDYAQTDYYITAPYMTKDNLAKTIAIQGDMVSNPTFDKDALESEKNPICSEISMMNDSATTPAFDKVVRNLFQIKSNSEHLVAGSIDTVSKLTREQVVNHHKTYYTPDNLATVVVGDVDPEETIKLIAKSFTLPPRTSYSQPQYKMELNPIQKAVREDIRSSKTNCTSVLMAFAGPKPTDSKDFVISHIVNYYLSSISTSQLKKTLEEMNAGFDSSLQKVGLNADDPYALMIALQTNPLDEQKGLDAFYDAILKLQTEPLADGDLQSAKYAIKKESRLTMSDSQSLCDTLGDAFLDKSFDLFSSYQGILDSITKEDIMNFAKKYYDLSKVSIVVVHPQSVSNEQIQKNYNDSKYSFKNSQKASMVSNNKTLASTLSPAEKISMTGNTYINNAISTYGYNSYPYHQPMVQNVPLSLAVNSSDGKIKVQTSGVEEMLLPNNMHVALNQSNEEMCIFNWSVNTPPIKPKNPNIPAVLSYMFSKGSEYKNQDELDRIKELNAIDTEVFVNEKGIKISANCLPEHTAKTLLLMNELMYNPNLTQNDFETAKKSVKDALLASQKDASTNLLDILYPGYFPTEAAMLKTIDALTLDDVKEFYQSLLTAASSSFVATVPTSGYAQLKNDVVEIQKATNFKFKKHTPKLTPIFKAVPESTVIFDTDDLNQAQISKAYKFPLSGNIQDEVKFELVNTILGAHPNARLFSDLREKQNLAYSVNSTIQSFENTGILTLKIQTTTDNKQAGVQSYDNVKKSLEGFNKHTELMCKELVSDEEFEAAKMRLKQKLIGDCQNPLSETSLLSMSLDEPFGIRRIDKYFEAIDSITKEDVKKAANFIFSYNPTISILASPDTIDSQIDYLKTQGTVYKAG